MAGDTQKRCPDCAELVQADARICRHCRYDFETGISGDGTRRQPAQAVPTQPSVAQAQPAPAMHPPAMHPPAQPAPTAARPRKRRRLTRRGWIVLGIIAAAVIVAIASSHHSSSNSSPPSSSSSADSGSSSPSSSSSGGASSSGSAPQSGAHVYVVASKSLCTYTGVDDAYTGDGHVEFFLTLKNSGDEDGKISIIPVRHYDDGQLNESAMDEVEVTVGAGQVWKGHTDPLKYKAHEHEIASCGVFVNGNLDNEISIGATGL